MRGFSLLEVLVATTILVVGVAALAHLVALAQYANLHGRQITLSTVLAQRKLEELLDAATGLTASPPDALEQNVAGYSDFFDAAGRVLDGGPTIPVGSVLVRRWSIDVLHIGSSDTSVLQVLVTDVRRHVTTRLATAKTVKVP